MLVLTLDFKKSTVICPVDRCNKYAQKNTESKTIINL